MAIKRKLIVGYKLDGKWYTNSSPPKGKQLKMKPEAAMALILETEEPDKKEEK